MGGTVEGGEVEMTFGMMRCKNEARWIHRSLTSLVKVCDIVYVLDDHSTDGTQDIIRGIEGCRLILSPFDTLDESRDKTWLLREITRRMLSDETDWVVCIDGDEEICLAGSNCIPPSIDPVVSYSFQILQLWDSPTQMRADPPYNNLLRPSMFRLIKPGMVFKSSAVHGGGFHCGNVPADIGFGVTVHDPVVRVKHYGYIERADRERKYKWYVEHDPGHESWYRGECFGAPVLERLPEGV